MKAIAMLCSALLLAGCGMTSSPADNLTFTAPKGWHSSPGIMGFVQFWESPGNKQQIVLVKSPKKISDSDVFTNANLKNSRVTTRKSIVICGGQAATLVTALASTSQGHDANAQLVKTDVGGSTYIVMYVYPVGSAPQAEAEGAVRELCVKR